MFGRRNQSSRSVATPTSSRFSTSCSSFWRTTDTSNASPSSTSPRSSRSSLSRLRLRSTARTPSNTSLPESNTDQTGTDWTYALTLTAAGVATVLFTGYTLHHCATNFSNTLGRDPIVGGALMVAKPAWSVAKWGTGNLGGIASTVGRSMCSVATGD